MGNTIFLKTLQNHFNISFSMLEKIIEICPEELWNKKKSAFVFWQQLFHTLSGMLFWFSDGSADFTEPFRDKNVFPELDHDPETMLAKDDIMKCCIEAKEASEKWFAGKDDEWLKLTSKIYDKLTNLDIITMQIRHIMYHIGHCEAIFRDNGIETGEYLDYMGKDS